MKSKKGISLAVAVIAVSVMLILVSVASVIGGGAITSANFEEHMSMLQKINADINAYYLENDKLPITSEIVSANSLGDDFRKNLIKNGDLENKLFVVDMVKLEDSTINYGKGTTSSKDVFVVAENTNNVYYLKGFEYKSVIYFGL